MIVSAVGLLHFLHRRSGYYVYNWHVHCFMGCKGCESTTYVEALSSQWVKILIFACTFVIDFRDHDISAEPLQRNFSPASKDLLSPAG